MSSVWELQDLGSSHKITTCFNIRTAKLEFSFPEVPEQGRTKVDPCNPHKDLSSESESSTDVSCLPQML